MIILRSFTILLLASPFLSIAQDRGFISGNLSYNRSTFTSEDIDGPTSTTVDLGPVIGFNIGEHIVVGSGSGWHGSHSESDIYFYDEFGLPDVATRTDITNMVTLTPFVRYVKKVSDQFTCYGFARIGLGIGTNTSELDVQIPNTKVTSDLMQVNVGIGPGLMYKLSPRWALTADWGVLGWTSTTTKRKDPDLENNSTELTANLNAGAITFGLNWLF